MNGKPDWLPHLSFFLPYSLCLRFASFPIAWSRSRVTQICDARLPSYVSKGPLFKIVRTPSGQQSGCTIP